MRVRRISRGFTLTETMMVVAITGILFAAGPPLLIQVQNFYLMTNARQSIERDARLSLDTINRFLREASASSINIDTPTATGTGKPCELGGGIYSRISFKILPTSNTPAFGAPNGVNPGQQVSFWQSGSNLCQSIQIWTNPGPNSTNYTTFSLNQTVLSQNLGYIGFGTPQTDNPSIVSVSMTMTKNIQLGKKKVLELTIQKVRVMNP